MPGGPSASAADAPDPAEPADLQTAARLREVPRPLSRGRNDESPELRFCPCRHRFAPPVLHLRGQVLVGPDEERAQAWVVGGRITYQPPLAHADAAVDVEGWVLPGLVDAHCHVGLDAQGAVDRGPRRQQAVADRDAGALLLRDAGSPADTRWIDEREDLPRIVRAGRHIARTERYIRNYAHEIEPDAAGRRTSRAEARRGDGWVKLVGDWIDRDGRRPRAVLAARRAAPRPSRRRTTRAPG